MKEKYLNLDWLWENKAMVHYFGLGFIQLKLNDSQRVHFYTDKLMKTVGNEEIHNHRYDFVSRILKGTFSQDIYDVEHVINDLQSYTHLMVQENCKEDNKLDLTPTKVNVRKFYSETLAEDQEYFMDHNTFHTVASSDAVTFLRRSNYKKIYADVVYPRHKNLTCPFSIKLSESEIFDILSDLLKS